MARDRRAYTTASIETAEQIAGQEVQKAIQQCAEWKASWHQAIDGITLRTVKATAETEEAPAALSIVYEVPDLLLALCRDLVNNSVVIEDTGTVAKPAGE